MSHIEVEFFINPLGTISVRWKLPSLVLLENKELLIQIPGFKYDLPKIAGIPVPFSSKAIKLNCEIVKVEANFQVKNEIIEDYKGNAFIKLSVLGEITKNHESDQIILEYRISDIVNNDGIYFVCVYPLINPFKNEVHYNIDLRARFSYKIRRYKFREWYFNKSTGKRIHLTERFKTSKNGDLISVRAKNFVLSENTELDIHLTGSRFPFMIRRDIFWLIIFFISLVIILTPISNLF